jgi:hypothetical protein
MSTDRRCGCCSLIPLPATLLTVTASRTQSMHLVYYYQQVDQPVSILSHGRRNLHRRPVDPSMDEIAVAQRTGSLPRVRTAARRKRARPGPASLAITFGRLGAALPAATRTYVRKRSEVTTTGRRPELSDSTVQSDGR